MMPTIIGQQAHGYRNGHQLLAGSVKLGRDDQDTVDRLSDMAGPLRPGETFAPYLTAYPLPSGSYNVLARTWQDRDAPRAGCVLTRSLILPAEEWRRLEDLERLLSLLQPVVRGAELPAGDAPSLSGGLLPPVQDSRTSELVEALFLENRQPTVMFEAPEAELMLHRLLVALWPGMRRNFAACTFALAPRKVGGRDFDLVFAPKSARSRFADWPGRRIEASAPSLPRHRWTTVTADRIFRAPKPNLTGLDTLGAMTGDDRGDSAALRLSLLWNELSAKAEESPNAVLGMLDILSSQPGLRAPPSLLAPAIERALRQVSRGPNTPEAWRFISTLVGKFPDAAPPRRIRGDLRRRIIELARRDPGAALAFLADEGAAGRELPGLVLGAVGDGLAAAPAKSAVAAQFERLESETVLRLLAYSRVATRWLGARIRSGDEEALRALNHALVIREDKLVARVRRAIWPFIDRREFAGALSALLRGLTPGRLEAFATALGRRTGFVVDAFDAPLGAAAASQDGLLALRRAALAVPAGPGADRFLLSTLRLDRADVEWLNAAVKPLGRVRALVARLLAQSDDRQLQAALRDSHLRDLLLPLLQPNDVDAAVQLSRVLQVAALPPDQYFALGRALLPHLPEPAASHLAVSLLEGALASSHPDDPIVRELLPQVGPTLDARRLIRMLTPPGTLRARVAANLLAAEAAPPRLRNIAVERVDELTSRLVSRGREDLGEAAYLAWARLISDAAKPVPSAHLAAAVEALDYALRHADCQASALVLVSFRTVYGRLPRKGGPPDLFTALMTLPLTLITGSPDPAKSARHELVDTFLRSVWPPANLILTAVDAGIDQRVLKRVRRSYRGAAYLAAIANDVKRLPPRERKMVREALDRFRDSSGPDFDD